LRLIKTCLDCHEVSFRDYTSKCIANPIAETKLYPNRHTDGNPLPYSHFHRDSYLYAIGNSHCYTLFYIHCNTNPHPDLHPYYYSHPHHYPHAHLLLPEVHSADAG
jgi:hypothetical protein